MDAVLRETDDGTAGAPDQRHRVLDSLTNRQRLTGEQAAARTELVKRLRIILPVVAGLLILALLFSTKSGSVDEAFLEDFANLEATPQEVRMANPRFAGVDEKGHPYDITADTALQAPGDREVVELVNPRAMTTGGDAKTEVAASKGVFSTKDNILDLEGGVTLNHSVGDEIYVFTTPSATVSIHDETVRSTSGVEGESGSGTLRADGMRAYNGEGRTVFEGNVSMRIFPSKMKAAEEAREDDEASQ